MERTTWPEQDRAWLGRYRRSMAGKPVPADALAEREAALLDAVRRAGVPADELFGDAGVLAAEDAADLATVEEAVRSSPGGGLRPALRDAGGALVGMAAVTVVLMVVRGGWTVDLELARLLVGAGVALLFVGWVVARALLAAGRPVSTAGLLVAVGAVAVGCVASAASLGPGHVLATGVPVPLVAVGMLAPGVLALVTAGRMAPGTLRTGWDDAAWLRRFRDGLRTRLVPAATVRGHVAEVEQALRADGASAVTEFGHPLVLARELADADGTARGRRWWVSTVTGVAAPLVTAALVLAMDSWGPLTVPVVVVLVLGALVTPVVGWDDRPWAERR